ncbi:hypothetical protein AAX26_01568 [Aliarcobacter thereius]|uniref:DUF4065 domain-containing protein n=2 Tax=Aliarcobacter thereius TaxID=544718 RepID=A0A1C0B6C7_9BACT|nr:type II toxin-antitoxin system antitoxin SocA domain-containing protein [Aliarcobacter thereius]OCL86435.1 hypothetical protein AAX26_01568 [Aliarcobacter thereius]OCL90119.1 hypothetical protein AAX25_01873 [Aliarcobacter thereius]OCL96281.1 hypothetical protein AA347_01772 [Aliarcobacter thereius LMG 24486]OCL98859.1 hypothetical protein AAX29_01369 [Aliarcobacter thereius]QBF15756.1 hypothetical protein ATH_0683 [Aliarcobacter thereius LMG 24486]
MINITKLANIILYLIHKQVKSLNHKKLELLLFFIEKNHIDFCGKKIINETFIKTPRGVKALVLDDLFSIILEEKVFNEDEEDDRIFFIQELMDFLDIEIVEKESYKELLFYKLEEDFDESLFSQSEMRTITKVLNEYKDISVRNLANESFSLEIVRKTDKDEVVL